MSDLPRPRVLALETSAPVVAAAPGRAREKLSATGGAALASPGGVVSREFVRGESAGRSLLSVAAELLAGAGLEPRDLDAVAVSIGPGSYTGLRIGVAAAKTLAWAAGVRLITVATLEALALEAAERFPDEAAGRLIVPVTDAKRGELYARLFEPSGGEDAFPRALTDDLLLRPEELLAELAERGRGALVVGSGAALVEPLAPGGGEIVEPLATGGDVIIIRRAPTAPSPGAVARLALARCEAGEFVADVHALAPVYLRPSEAETRRAER